MSESYPSVLRTYFTRNLFEGNILPPADFTLVGADCLRQITDLNYSAGGGGAAQQPINPETNLYIRNAGVFSNFADGLVFKNPWQRVDLEIRVRAYTRGGNLTGTLAAAMNSKTLTGAGTAFVAEVPPGSMIEWEPNVGGPREVGIVNTVTDNTHLDLNNYPLTNIANCSFRILTPVGSGSRFYQQLSLPTLNQMFYVNHFVNLTNVTRDGILLDAILNHNAFSAVHDTVFLTKSISTDFDGDAIHFDGAVDVEFTEATS